MGSAMLEGSLICLISLVAVMAVVIFDLKVKLGEKDENIRSLNQQANCLDANLHLKSRLADFLSDRNAELFRENSILKKTINGEGELRHTKPTRILKRAVIGSGSIDSVIR